MDYLRDHWRGRHSLFRAFWINFLLPVILIALVEPLLWPPAEDGHSKRTVVAASFTVSAHMLLLPWQIVGLWRSSRRHLAERGDQAMVTFAQTVVLLALVAAAVDLVATTQRLIGLGHATRETIAGAVEAAKPLKRYQLSVLSGDGIKIGLRAVRIQGIFDIGLSRDVETVLAENPDIGAIILQSDGGRVFEARGVARQILEKGLDTYVFGQCRSACTIPFIAGHARRLGETARLGFHSYRLSGVAAFMDPLDEQEKDRSFFSEQGVDKSFVARAFATPPDSMWQPDIARLLAAGVVHQVIDDHRKDDRRP